MFAKDASDDEGRFDAGLAADGADGRDGLEVGALQRLTPDHDGGTAWGHDFADGGRDGRDARGVHGHVVDARGGFAPDEDGKRAEEDFAGATGNAAWEHTRGCGAAQGGRRHAADHDGEDAIDDRQGQRRMRHGRWNGSWWMNRRMTMGSILFDHIADARSRRHDQLRREKGLRAVDPGTVALVNGTMVARLHILRRHVEPRGFLWLNAAMF